jgi:hypothetical protein
MSVEKVFYPFECRLEKSQRQKRKLVREREDKMKTLRCLVIVVVGVCFAAMVYSAEKEITIPVEKRGINPQPEPPAKSITLPLGTKVEKMERALNPRTSEGRLWRSRVFHEAAATL